MVLRNTKRTRTEFPWWEVSRTGGWRGFLGLLRPGLLVLVFTSALLFVVEFEFAIPADGPTTNTETSSSALFDRQGSGENVFDDDGNSISTPPQPSLIGSLFGADSVDPLFRLPNIEIPGGGASQDASPQQRTSFVEPGEEPQRSIWRYLVASSEIGFTNNESRLGIALATAEQGETDAINRLIADLEQKLLEFAALTPPKELAEAHEASIAVTERYINHLRNARDKTEGSVEATWRSPEREAIAEEAAEVTQTIRDIVHSTQTALPPGVLP